MLVGTALVLAVSGLLIVVSLCVVAARRALERRRSAARLRKYGHLVDTRRT